MSISLSDALQPVDLEVGRVYQCEVGPLHVEVRVGARDTGPLPRAAAGIGYHARPLDRLAGTGAGEDR